MVEGLEEDCLMTVVGDDCERVREGLTEAERLEEPVCQRTDEVRY